MTQGSAYCGGRKSRVDNRVNYTVIGAGHGGKAMAAHLALMGFEVTLYNRTPESVTVIKARGGIELVGPTALGGLVW